MKKIKKLIATLVIAGTIGNVAPAPQAQAGIILLPVIIGYWILLQGIATNNIALVLLGADGNMKQDALENFLAQNYGFIEDRDVISQLAYSIREKAAITPVVDGKMNVTLSKDEVLKILAPTGLADLEPVAVAKLIQDLQ
jgi:hypothetical protein